MVHVMCSGGSISSSDRAAQAAATRQRIVTVAVELLIAQGVAATTTAEVQRACGLSRGALLHHFPTREALLAATVRALRERNETSVRQAEEESPEELGRVDRAIRVLGASVVRPAFVAELELWSAARADTALREVLRREEQRGRGDLYRVVADVFGDELTSRERYPMVAALTVHFLRGLAITEALRGEGRGTEALIADWSAVTQAILAGEPLNMKGAVR